MNKTRTLIIGSAVAGAFVLGAVFGHLKPWQRKVDKRIDSLIAEHVAREAIPRVLARCIATGIAVPELPSDPYDENGDRRSYVMACMRGEGYEYDVLAKMLGGEDCDVNGYHQSYRDERCYRQVSR
jgi:hypothetical protein